MPRLATRVRHTYVRVTTVSHPFLTGLRQGLSELGYEESKNITIEYRFGTKEELPKLAEELARLQVDVIVAGGSEGIMASKKATQTIPIVMTNSGDWCIREPAIRF
jgi:ABC-type uncharacterized transport system substrate-binding protein